MDFETKFGIDENDNASNAISTSGENPMRKPPVGEESDAADRNMKRSNRAMVAGSEPDPSTPSEEKEVLEAPFSFSTSHSEEVMLNNGALQYSVTDFVLPGRNGFDLSITRCYDSDKSALNTINPTHNGYGKFGTASRPNQHALKNYGMGYGWSFKLPSIETVPIDDRNSYMRYSTLLHLEDGRTFSISEAKGKVTGLSDHPMKDVSIIEAAGTIKHAGKKKDFHVKVDYKDGSADYFQRIEYGKKTQRYTLVARKDRFGNTMLFTFSRTSHNQNDGDFNGITIIDTWGKAVKLVKLKNTLTWTLPDGKTIQYKVNTAGGNKLEKVIDRKGRTTSYNYYSSDSYKGACRYCSPEKGNKKDITCKYMLLKSVKHPSGATQHYEYGMGKTGELLKLITNKDGGYQHYYPVFRRKDYGDGQDQNAATYAYKRSPNLKYLENATVTLLNNVIEKHSFDSKGKLTKKEVTHNKKKVSNTLYAYGRTKNAPDYKLLIKETETLFDSSNSTRTFTKITERKYSTDKKANLIKVSETYPDNTSLNQTISMSYGDFSILTEKTCKKNSITTIKEQYVLKKSLGNRVVEYSQVYENSNLKEKTRYIYGTNAFTKYLVVEDRCFFTTGSVKLEEAKTHIKTTYKYDSLKHTCEPVMTAICGVKDADGKNATDLKTTADYNKMGWVIKKTAPKGDFTAFTYDALGRITKETYKSKSGAALASVSYSYNDAENSLTVTDENGNKTRYEYTQLGQLKKEILIGANVKNDVLVSQIEYDKSGRVTNEKTFDGKGKGTANVLTTTAYTYDSSGRVTTKTIKPIGYQETHSYSEVHLDKSSQEKYALHKKTMTGETGAPSLTSIEWSDQLGQVKKEFAVNEKTLIASYTYDKLGNMLSKKNAGGFKTNYTYDHAGNVLSTSYTIAGIIYASKSVYDALGNEIASYDLYNRRTDKEYDNAGRQTKIISPFDARKAETKFYYDENGNITRQLVNQGSYWRKTCYGYDERNRQTHVDVYKDSSQYERTQTFYDKVGNKTEVRTGLTHAITTGYASIKYSYNRFGSPVEVTDASGRKVSYNFDNIGRLTSKTDRNGSVMKYTLDKLGRVVKETVSAKNRLGTITSTKATSYYCTGKKKKETAAQTEYGKALPTLPIEYFYNNKGQLALQKDPGGVEKAYTYDENGNRASFVLRQNSREQINLYYAYDKLDRLVTVREKGADGAVLATYVYDRNGNRTRQEFPKNKVKTTSSYNKGGLLTRETHTNNGKQMSFFDYSYSLDGNQTSRYDGKDTITYRYDQAGRLIKEDDPKWNTLEYTYDLFGNRSKVEVSGGDKYTEVYTYDKSNRLLKKVKTESSNKYVETTVYSYDNNGNQLKAEWQRAEKPERTTPAGKIYFARTHKTAGKTTLDTRVYDGYNRLSGIQADAVTLKYRYLPDGLRYSKETKNPAKKGTVITRHHWDGQNMVLETTGTGAIRSAFLRGNGLIAQRIDEKLYFYLHNAHGDVIRRVGQDGNAGPIYKYDAFGVPFRDALAHANDNLSTDPNPFRYCGEYWDEETEEYYLRARNYNPEIGRFTTEDPSEDGDNWYVYCRNNPVSWIDPSGCSEEKVSYAHVAIGAAIIIGLGIATVLTGGTAAVILGAAFGGAILGGAVGAGSAAANGEDVGAGFLGGTITGGIMGALTGVPATATATAAAAATAAALLPFVGALTSGADAAYQSWYNTGEIDLARVGVSAGFGALSGYAAKGVGRISDSFSRGDANPKLMEKILKGFQFLFEEPLKYTLSGISNHMIKQYRKSYEPTPSASHTQNLKNKQRDHINHGNTAQQNNSSSNNPYIPNSNRSDAQNQKNEQLHLKRNVSNNNFNSKSGRKEKWSGRWAVR